MQVSIPTNDDIRSLVREELAAFFSSPNFQQKPEVTDLGDVQMAAEITGKAVPTIYSLVCKRQIPHSKQGKKLYFSRAELLQWIQSGKRRTVAEIQTTAGIN